MELIDKHGKYSEDAFEIASKFSDLADDFIREKCSMFDEMQVSHILGNAIYVKCFVAQLKKRREERGEKC